MTQETEAYALGQADTRPWGEWRVVDLGPGFVVKRITVRPGGRLSLQRHRHRDEVWTIAAGTAKATLDGTTCILNTGETIRIARGQTHRVENEATTELVFIEVQTGPVLAEDDIERLEDAYGRISDG
jgi:mannose-6-phosphate isomerase-like protein (cupin superfamily)